MAELRFFKDTVEITRAVLDGRLTTIGRGSQNDLLVPDLAVSRQHCCVQKSGEKWILRDLSGNGTDVEGKPVPEIELWDGAVINLAHVRIVFSLGAKDAQASSVTQRIRSGNTIPEIGSRAPRSVGPMRLHVAGQDGERSIPFSGQLVVGSGEESTLRLQSPVVSTRHLSIERRPRGFFFKDLGSRNGTWLGDTQIFEAMVAPGRAVRVGTYELTLRGVEEEQDGYHGIVGRDRAMREVYETVERVAASQALVTIFGESGTGKELVARAIHERSDRAERPFVPVNCAELKELVESQLFGHVKGAFTGADREFKGAFGEAEGGTLFLDEIGELPLDSQAKLLRALDCGEIKPVGAALPVHANVRVVAATNRDLGTEVRRGRFREDLYWRIRVINIVLPPLRKRQAELGLLIRHFLEHHSPEDAEVEIAEEAERLLLDHEWPGNVRELKHTLLRSLWLRKGNRIEAGDIKFDEECLLEPTGKGMEDPDAGNDQRVFIVGKSLAAIEEEVLIKTYRRLKTTSPTKLGKALSLSRATVYRKFVKLGLEVGKDE